MGGLYIDDSLFSLEKVILDGRCILKVLITVDSRNIYLHRLIFIAGRYHYRFDFNERKSAHDAVNKFFDSISIPIAIDEEIQVFDCNN